MPSKKTVNVHDVHEAQKTLFETNYTYWMEHVLFSFNWWFLIILSIIPWFFWWKFVDKKRLLEISCIGFLSMLIALCLDLIGTSFVFWSYQFNLVQMLLPLCTIDMTLLPILNMLLYQLFPKWKSYIVASIVVALIGTFLAEPLFVWMGIYILHSWEHIYSLPIYIAIAISLKWFMQKMKACQANAKK